MGTVVRGEVRWGPAPFKGSGVYRPWLVLSEDSHPFSGVECIAVGLTTTAHECGIRITSRDWTDGGTFRESYVSPWYPTTLEHADAGEWQGLVDADLVDRVADRRATHVGATGDG